MPSRYLLPIILTLCLSIPAGAKSPQLDDSGKLTLTTKRIVVFKNGHGLFVKEARGRTGKSGELFTDQVPDAASLGSFWMSDRHSPHAALVASRAERVERESLPSKAQTLFEMLSANQGKKALVLTRDGKEHQGVIRSVLRTSPPDDLARAGRSYPLGHSSVMWSSIARPAPDETGASGELVRLERPAGSLFILDTDKGDLALAVSDVLRFSVDQMKIDLTQDRVTTRQVKLLTVRYPEPKSGQKHELDMIYFRPGIRWIPTYRVELGDDGLAQLVMQAEIINEAEDFEDSAVDFVVGLPTFKFQDVVSPLSLERVMLNTLSGAAPQLMGQLAVQNFSNAVFDNRARRNTRSGRLVAHAPEMDLAVKAMAGMEVQDLYYYSIDSLSLRKGERAVVEVMRAKVPYRHLYTWDLALGQGGSSLSRSASSPLVLGRNKVWHQVVLHNSSGRPWTTGPAMLLERGLPLGQDMMTFTPAGREVNLPVTAAVSVRGTLSEKEISRKYSAKRIHGNNYSLVRNRAEFTIVNSLKVPVHLTIRAEVDGRCYGASKGGKITRLGRATSDHSPLKMRSRVTWELDLKPGQEHKVSARYLFYLME